MSKDANGCMLAVRIEGRYIIDNYLEDSKLAHHIRDVNMQYTTSIYIITYVCCDCSTGAVRPGNIMYVNTAYDVANIYVGEISLRNSVHCSGHNSPKYTLIRPTPALEAVQFSPGHFPRLEITENLSALIADICYMLVTTDSNDYL